MFLAVNPAASLLGFSSRACMVQDRRKSGGFRLRLGGGLCAPAAIRYALLSALRSTFPARRPQTEA